MYTATKFMWTSQKSLKTYKAGSTQISLNGLSSSVSKQPCIKSLLKSIPIQKIQVNKSVETFFPIQKCKLNMQTGVFMTSRDVHTSNCTISLDVWCDMFEENVCAKHLNKFSAGTVLKTLSQELESQLLSRHFFFFCELEGWWLF